MMNRLNMSKQTLQIALLAAVVMCGCTKIPPNVNETVNGYSFEMVYVSGGRFTMGCNSEQWSDCNNDESPSHSVTLSSYYIGKYEATQRLWKAVMGSLPSSLTSASSYGYGDEYPVYYVSWNDIAGKDGFIDKLNGAVNRTDGMKYRLPTEAEWEYAARGGQNSNGYKYSGSNDIDQVAWHWDNIPSQSSGTSGHGTQPVGGKHTNELGIHDMGGNVWEWVNDWYGDYPSTAQTNPTGQSTGSDRVGRGGSWFSDAGYCRVSFRNNGYHDYGSYNLGFRLVLSH